MTFKQWFHRKTGHAYNPNFSLSTMSSAVLEQVWKKSWNEALEKAALINELDAQYSFENDETTWAALSQSAAEKIRALKEKL